MSPERAYIADIRGVREVTLLGSADPGFWGPRLEVEGLVPTLENGRARLILIAGDMRFHGIRFREFSLSVQVEPPRPGMEAAVFLEWAFNSNRFFSWSERVFFHTPYAHGRVEVEAVPPAWVRVQTPDGGLFLARMGPVEAADLPAPADEALDGPAYLPSSPRGVARKGRAFYGRVEGRTFRIPFRPGWDRLEVSDGDASLQVLRDCDFAPDCWVVRPEARHCKSRTLPLNPTGRS
jgi:hypothetical protein